MNPNLKMMAVAPNSNVVMGDQVAFAYVEATKAGSGQSLPAGLAIGGPDFEVFVPATNYL